MGREDWTQRSLSEIADFRNGKSHGNSAASQIGLYPMFGANGIIGRMDRYIYDAPLVVIGRVGAYCGSLYWSNSPSWVTDNAIGAIAKDGTNSRYLYYLLKSLDVPRIAIGSAQPLITQSALNILQASVPPLAEQRSIASILGALDEKIELNRKTSATLEAIARALFKSWFVDFDPVRAKNKGNDVGLPLDISDLFPDSLQNSELGEIPTGWKVREIRNLTSVIQYGLTTSAKRQGSGRPQFLRITDIQGGHINWSNVPFCDATEDERKRYALHQGDIVVARTGASTGENIYLHRIPDAVFASYLVRFQFSEKSMARFVGSFMRSPAYFEYVANSIGGSAQPNASAQVLAGAKLGDPGNLIVQKYADIVCPLDDKIQASNAESQTLAALRDVLLPKLISGELRVRDAERILEKSA